MTHASELALQGFFDSPVETLQRRRRDLRDAEIGIFILSEQILRKGIKAKYGTFVKI